MLDAADGIWVINDSGKTIYANERMAAILGIPRTELMGVHSFDFVFSEDRGTAEALFAKKGQGDSDPFRFRLRRRDGSPVWVSVQGTPMHDSHRRFSGIVGTFTVIEPPAQVAAT